MIKTLITILVFNSIVFAQDIYATFNVKALKESKLTLSSSGIVEKIYVDVGSDVKKGDLLLELDNDDIKTSLELEKNKVKLAELNLKYAKKAYERIQKIKDVIDEEKFDNAISNYERSQIELAKAKASLANTQARLDKTYLKAPFDGTISKKSIELGSGVSSAKMDPLFTLITPNELILEISIDEKYADVIKPSQSFSYSIGVNKEKKVGKISKIYPSINPNKRSITIEVPAHDMKVGMFGYGHLKVD